MFKEGEEEEEKSWAWEKAKFILGLMYNTLGSF